MKFCIYIYNVYIDVRQETETKPTTTKPKTMYKLTNIKSSQKDLDEKMNTGIFLEPSEEDLYNVQKNVIEFCELIKSTEGFGVEDIDFSGASMSTYVEVIETGSGEDFYCKVRFSNHDAKPYHGSHDIDFNTGNFMEEEAQRVFDFINEQVKDEAIYQ